jgi:glycosyltransferase involved in cell wall biosynthesis
MEKVLVLIPAYNASETLSSLIEQILPFFKKEDILVVDDGSVDRTFDIAKKKEVVVLRHKENQGKGKTLLTGFDFALKKGYDGVLTLDADLQHPPELIDDFLIKKEKNKNTILLGTRKRNLLNMPFPRFVTNFLTSLIISVIAGKRIYDSQSGYRLIPICDFKKMRLKSKEYQLESEILLKGARLGFNFYEIPIPTIYAGSKSYINPFVDTIRFLYILWKSLWW